MTKENQISVLNDLLARTYDAESGYQEAAKNVNSRRLKEMFEANADQRKIFKLELMGCVEGLGGTPHEGQTLSGQSHQIWIDIRTAFSSNNDETVLIEVNRGEQYALEAYDKALENIPIGTVVYDRVVAQRNQVRTVYERTQNLEDIFANAT
ncbi:MAG: PA2169 family four-helix-bundle protein [Bacteroidota bacterium]